MQQCLHARGPCSALPPSPGACRDPLTPQHCSLKPWGPGQSQAEDSPGEEVRPPESRPAVTPTPAYYCALETPPAPPEPTKAAALIASDLNPAQPGPAGSLQDWTG